MNYKVCIPTAGIGSRLNDLCVYLNKSLLSIANKPVVSHIIENLAKDIPFVIATGYKGELVQEFLPLAYPERTFEFVEVHPYEGPGSCLGYSILQCKDLLQCPFIFCSCDTIVTEPVPPPGNNWMGYAEVEDVRAYRTIRIKNGKVTELCEKSVLGDDLYAYIGLAGICDYKEFWARMIRGQYDGAIEMGESYGLRALVGRNITPLKFTWLDTGNPQALSHTREVLRQEHAPNILDKPNEAIWFVNGHVIKFSADKTFIKNRVARSEILKGYCPEITASTEHMYQYKKLEGTILSEAITIPLFDKLLNSHRGFWQEKKLRPEEEKHFKSVCRNFYKDKTKSRIELFYQNFSIEDRQEDINGIDVPQMSELLKQLDWYWISDGVPGNFHGDYHFENILYTPKEDKFCLLDWRQDFGGLLEVGDIYYDFAKLNHGLIICHELIAKNLFSVHIKGNKVRFDFLRKQILVECERKFEIFIRENGYDYKKVQVLTALIFLNIAALHHYPYSLLLYYLGKFSLFQLLNTKQNYEDDRSQLLCVQQE